jgi:serine/threonine protein kinase
MRTRMSGGVGGEGPRGSPLSRFAIKLIKGGMDTREVVARFESERQALALMDHHAIAKVFDAGSTPQGRPYFVMEYVAGVPITEYCDEHKLTTHERLELFVDVCEGVQHAHQRAIPHRDLKPSNILVSEVDGKPMPKIIDFGVAKATSQPLTAATMFTQLGSVIGTPAYMSPEQAGSFGSDVDTRTDVYSLGVMLYELLVGTLPVDLSKIPFDQIPRALREQDAPRPSAKLRTLGERSGVTAQNRGTDAPTLARRLRGDLDAITLSRNCWSVPPRFSVVEVLFVSSRLEWSDEAVVAGWVKKHLGCALCGAFQDRRSAEVNSAGFLQLEPGRILWLWPLSADSPVPFPCVSVQTGLRRDLSKLVRESRGGRSALQDVVPSL